MFATLGIREPTGRTRNVITKADLKSGSKPPAVPDSSKAGRRGRKNNGHQEAKETRIMALRQEVNENIIGGLPAAKVSYAEISHHPWGHRLFDKNTGKFTTIGPHFNYVRYKKVKVGKNGDGEDIIKYIVSKKGHVFYPSNHNPLTNQ